LDKNKNYIKTDLVVIGSGPGGYTAAFRAADLGLDVILVDKNQKLGGVCLNRGCIPSKAYLHLSKIIDEAQEAKDIGLNFQNLSIDFEKIKLWKDTIINNLSSGIKSLAKQRQIKIINGKATFLSADKLLIEDKQKKNININFLYCIIATGSSPSIINNLNINHPRIISSTKALSLNKIPKRMLIIGGGYIGLELGTAYSSFGSKVTIAEFFPKLLSMADQDLVNPLYKNLKNKFEQIYLSTEVKDLKPNTNNVIVTFKKNGSLYKDAYDIVLICIGRTPNTYSLNLEKAGIKLDKNGFIPINKKRRTIIPNIYAIGDVTGNPMLAHKATHEAKVAAENIAGLNATFEPKAIPSVIYTNPEIAWIGYTENELKNSNTQYNKAIFPWSASGRAIAVNSSNGKTKILSSKDNSKILGVGIVGVNAGELISEAALAIELNATIDDIANTIHPHPTLSETFANTAEILNKTITDLYIKK
jgi:dihydrolipoamide dehydrogenase